MMPIKTTITKILKRSNSFCDGSKYETQTFDVSEQGVHDSYSTDAVDILRSKNVELSGPVERCGGDFREDVNSAPKTRATFRDVTEEDRYKDTVIGELQKSNHELRIKCAEAENKLAQLRLRIEAHCECCSKGLGVEDYTEQKGYSDWSSLHSGLENCHPLNPLFWNSRDYSGMELDASPFLNKASLDILNPYVKVKRWQDSLDLREAKETDSSTGSTYATKRSSRPISPQDASARSAPLPRAQSPCSGLSNEYMMLPVSTRTPPGVMHNRVLYDNINKLDKNCFYLQKSLGVGGNVKVEPESCEDHNTRRLSKATAKSTPEEWKLRCGGQHQSDSSLPVHNSNNSCQIRAGLDDRREQLFMSQFTRSMSQSMHKSWTDHEQNQSFRRWSTQNETNGIVGGLMKAVVDHSQVPREPI